MKKIREVFADTVESIGIKNNKLVVLVGDISHGIFKNYAKKAINRYYNIGICEPSIVNIAAGLSKIGLIPVVHTIAPFLIERSYEQIKLDFGYQKLGVNLVSVGSSFDYSKLGCSHHTYSDVSLIGHLKNSTICTPASAIEFIQMFKTRYNNNKINYFRISDTSHSFKFNKEQLKKDKAIKIKNGKNLSVIVMGPHLDIVNDTILELESQFPKFSIEIIYVYSFKPFDKLTVLKSIKKSKKFITIEDLSINDGLYSKCVMAINGSFKYKSKQIAVDDFVTSYGTFDNLRETIGISKKNIKSNILKILKS
tara:strand:- start:14209 stop:15135 length:927 start_codon:yes stop_codon:yes gene_type:complete